MDWICMLRVRIRVTLGEHDLVYLFKPYESKTGIHSGNRI